jgi:hypothetical protein
MKSRLVILNIAVVTLVVLSVSMAAQDSSTPNRPPHRTYRLVDMGTFGGAQSYVNEQVNGAPSQNNRGDLVGSAEGVVPLGQLNNFFPCFPGPNVNHAFRYHGGQVEDLGAFLPPTATVATPKAPTRGETSPVCPKLTLLTPS